MNISLKSKACIVLLCMCFYVNLFFTAKSEDGIQLLFYNVENLFDTLNDPNKNDDAFTPEGDMRWTSYKYQQKQSAIYKVIMAMGGWNPPHFIGLCEVENREVLEELAYRTPLSAFRYEVVHQNSPDRRGIDVALLYRTNHSSLLHEEYIRYTFSADTSVKSRDILFASFLIGTDTLHLFVNHWPSRRGGQTASEPRRIAAAQLLRHKIDSLYQHTACPNILIMGDFNDTPQDISLTKYLGARALTYPIEVGTLYNLAYHGKGTYKFRHYWSMLDQMIVSCCLLSKDNALYTEPEAFRIGDFDFLFTDDPRFGGQKLFRMYQGPKYLGGYSDHLPISLILQHRAE